MLQSFNDRLKGPFTWIIIISISFVFVITGMSFFFTNVGASKSYVAKVGGNEISTKQFEQYTQNATSKIQKQQLLDQLVNQYLVLADSQQHNIQISKLMLQAAIFSNPMFFENGKFSSDKLKQLATYFGGLGKLEQMLLQNIKASIIPQTIMDTSFITDYEKKSLSEVYSVNKTIEYIKISSKDLKDQIKTNTQVLKDYYKTHKNEYISPAKLDISYIVISKDDFKPKTDISDSQIKEYYENNRDLFEEFNNNTKETIKKIIQNRDALQQYNSYIKNVDSIKFAELEKKVGKPKIANVVDNQNTNIEGIESNLFFVSTGKYASIPLSEDKTLIYQVNKQQKAMLQLFDKVKEKVAQAYILEQLQVLALEKSNKILAELNKNQKVQQRFEKAVVSSNSKTLSKDFSDFVLLNSNTGYHEYKALDGNIYIYKVMKIQSENFKKATIPDKVETSYKQEELNFYLQNIKENIPVKIDYKYLNE
ncbi:SurA N-terminal domain-containing protein [Allofrancisella guangzhouensis]|uniref:PpiC domain-containing protein n=1 Tax=Allofrancisella guangzhouensis TaxID=594679 RepID=A0A0A8E4C5_9GAMM|nr:SurA N-terminal domain-containing protein [Allofrancisella guangzhouensis]AJC48814.1 hypothetical protein SD28_03785 [Allofrancisella guangzhouensis]MBK2027134.1 SurA N-terminal domain-containing protein [Allofrancisella guangzhouensis]MBK2044472.1 SurA N-terminal domain-containing protein [Allofrancisella guangzhouensis]MBK2046017.1 SurA N-terminal domain-containing protein [Allofrancisella guangzhouensis]